MLADKILSWMDIADKRNLAVENPVTLIVKYNDEDFYVVVAHLEPNHVTLPLNVTWIVADPDSANYMKALRRVSALPAMGYRNTWAQLMTEEDLAAELQFWDVSSSFQLGEVQVTGVTYATPDSKGLFSLNLAPTDPLDPVVVSSDDPRMSDERQPITHTHPNLPATMILGATGINDYFIHIDGSAPVSGQILVITAIDEDQKEAYGTWVNPTLSMIDYAGPSYDSLVISSSATDNQVNEGVPVVFSAVANFSGGIQQGSIPASWSIISGNAAGNINASTGVFTSNDIVGDQLVRVRAEWTHTPSNTTHFSTYDLTVIDTTVIAQLVSIEIQGIGNMNEGGNTTPYVVIATYDDNTTRAVTPTTFTSSNSAAGTLNSTTGIFTSASNVTSNQSTTLSASYTENGVTRADTLSLTVVDTTIYPSSATVIGTSTVGENTTTTYTLEVLFTDNSSSQVIVSNWNSTNAAAGSIDANTGVFTAAASLDEDESTVVSASFTSNGVTVTGNKTVLVQDTTIYPVSAVVLGSASVNEGQTSTYQLRVSFSNSTQQVVAVTDWASSNTTAGTINASTGLFTAGQVGVNTPTTLSASYTQAGQTVSADLVVNVVDTTNYPVSLQILGNATMNEGTTQTLTARVTYQDTTTAIVPVTYVSSNTAAATVSANGGVVTAALNLQANASTVITATYVEHGTTVNATLNITVQDVTIYPVSAVILGLNTVSEGINTTYTLQVTFNNSSVSTVPVTTWALSNSAAGTISTAGVLTPPANVGANINANVTASYTVDGVTVNATKAITVTDNTVYPASATIIGPATVNENGTQTYTLRVDFSNATNQIVTVTDWASDNTSVATINANTGVLTTLEQVGGNGSVTISASYTAEGVTVNDSLAITVVDTTIYPVSAEIVGTGSIDENGSETFVFRVTYSDNSTNDVTISNWASSNSSAGVINANTGLFTAAADISEDLSTTITGSYTEAGETVNATRVITVVDATNYPVSAIILGPVSVNESGNATYTLQVTFTDTTNQVVAVTDWASSNGAAGSIDSVTGVFTAASNSTGANINTTLSASYTAEGQTVSATRNISVVDTTVYPVSAIIEGPTTLSEGAVATFGLRVTFSDSTNSLVVADSWTHNNATAGAFTNGSEFTASDTIIGNKTTTITASYTSNGVTVSDTHGLTVNDTKVRPVSATIVGSSSILETVANTVFTLSVTFDDGSTSSQPVTDWASSNAAAGAINANTGVFTPANITADQSTNITASYTAHGATVNATKALTVTYVRIPVSATINGLATMPEGGSATTYSLSVTFDDGSTVNNVAVNTWARSNAAAGSIAAASGLFTPAANVTSNQSTNITASYTEAGATVNASLPVTVTNALNRPVSATILGVNTLAETNATTYQFRVTYEDGTNSVQPISNWASSNAAAGSINASSGVFTAANVTGNQTTNITGSYTLSGFTVNATLALTVEDAPSAGPRARWGTAQFSDTDFTGGKTWPNQAGGTYTTWTGLNDFVSSVMTTVQNDAGPYNLLLSLPFEPNPIYGYFMHPASMGTGVFVDNDTTFPGSWDGMTWQDGSVGDGPGETLGPMTVMYDDGNGLEAWNIYRTDFSGLNDINFTVTVS